MYTCTHAHIHRLSSDSDEDSDDPYSWIAKRKQSGAQPPSPSSPLIATTRQRPTPSNRTTPRPHPSQQYLAANDHHTPNHTLHGPTRDTAGQNDRVPDGRPKLNGATSKPSELPSVDPAQSKADHLKTEAAQDDHTPSIISQKEASQIPQAPPLETDRQCSTDSLTQSSEYSSQSEGEFPYVPLVTDIKVTAKSAKSNRKGTGSQRSSKKSKKKGGRSQQVGKERRVLQRTRSDSYTTSSDEERWLEGWRAGSGREGEEGREVANEEQVKAKLQRRIESRKPPALFETPATDPIFHQVKLDT